MTPTLLLVEERVMKTVAVFAREVICRITSSFIQAEKKGIDVHFDLLCSPKDISLSI